MATKKFYKKHLYVLLYLVAILIVSVHAMTKPQRVKVQGIQPPAATDTMNTDSLNKNPADTGSGYLYSPDTGSAYGDSLYGDTGRSNNRWDNRMDTATNKQKGDMDKTDTAKKQNDSLYHD